jgi:hypothetical protein
VHDSLSEQKLNHYLPLKINGTSGVLRARADENLTAFVEREWPIRLDANGGTQIVFRKES